MRKVRNKDTINITKEEFSTIINFLETLYDYVGEVDFGLGESLEEVITDMVTMHKKEFYDFEIVIVEETEK